MARTRLLRSRAGLRLLLFVVIAAARAGMAARVPAETSDVLRNLGYGRAYWSQGFRVYDIRADTLGADRGWGELWYSHSYDYPATALLFFALVAGVSTSLVVARLVLTGIDLAAALLLGRLTGSPWLALACFASPASLWWVSQEGQFEPVAALLSLAAVAAVRARRDAAGGALLSLAVQAKLFPGVLLAWLAVRARWKPALGGFAAALLPSAAALACGTYFLRMFDSDYRAWGFNPFFWDPRGPEPFAWMPRWLVLACAIYSCSLLFLALAGLTAELRARRFAAAAAWLPFLGFLVFLKSASWAQFWYALLLPAFAAPIERSRLRDAAILLALLEPRALSGLLFGPVGLGQYPFVEGFLHGGA